MKASNLNVVARPGNSLGEGLLWHPGIQCLYWTDINLSQLWRASHSNQPISHLLEVPATALAIRDGATDSIWILTNRGIERFQADSGSSSPLGTFSLPVSMRTNDGNPGPDGRYWFGSMQRTPTEREGSIFSVGVNGDYREEVGRFGIPNTFASAVGSPYIYISDSLLQCTYRFDLGAGEKELFLDFSSGTATPDGGALDAEGNLWIAMWDGHCVKCFSPAGEELATIELPVPRPTNCCFGGPDNKTLYITSARDGLDQHMLDKYPLSGSLFSVELPHRGAPLPCFSGVRQC